MNNHSAPKIAIYSNLPVWLCLCEHFIHTSGIELQVRNLQTKLNVAIIMITLEDSKQLENVNSILVIVTEIKMEWFRLHNVNPPLSSSKETVTDVMLHCLVLYILNIILILHCLN